MEKKQFIKLIKELVSIKKAEDKLNIAFKEFNSDFNFISFSRYETLVVESLELAVNDKSQWISYWLYECNMGTGNLKVWDKNKKRIPFKTPSDLYDCIKNY
jgi:hypothetical protein